MKLYFTVENGETFLTLTMAVEDKNLIDTQCQKLGLSQATTVNPLGSVTTTSIPFWKDTRAGQLAAAIQRRLTRDLRVAGQAYRYCDDINAPLFTGEIGQSSETVNIGVLRFRPEAGAPLKLKISGEILDPEVIMHIANAITKALQTLATIVFEATYEIIVESPRRG